MVPNGALELNNVGDYDGGGGAAAAATGIHAASATVTSCIFSHLVIS